jgi:hypothetical protein
MNRTILAVTATAAVATGGVALLLTGAFLGSQSGPREVPVPGPTVTVTASASAQPKAALPPECVQYYLKAQELPAAVAAYEKNLGDTAIIQNLAVQGIMNNSIKIMNASRQGMIDLQNATIQSLEDLNSLQSDLQTGASACRRASTP